MTGKYVWPQLIPVKDSEEYEEIRRGCDKAGSSRDGISVSWMNAVRTPFNQFGRALITAYPLLILSTTRLGTATWS